MPAHIPKVQEIGTSSAPLLSASFYIGARCRDYNDDYMQCKTESHGRGEFDCMKEGRKVTRCASSVYVRPCILGERNVHGGGQAEPGYSNTRTDWPTSTRTALGNSATTGPASKTRTTSSGSAAKLSDAWPSVSSRTWYVQFRWISEKFHPSLVYTYNRLTNVQRLAGSHQNHPRHTKRSCAGASAAEANLRYVSARGGRVQRPEEVQGPRLHHVAQDGGYQEGRGAEVNAGVWIA